MPGLWLGDEVKNEAVGARGGQTCQNRRLHLSSLQQILSFQEFSESSCFPNSQRNSHFKFIYLIFIIKNTFSEFGGWGGEGNLALSLA